MEWLAGAIVVVAFLAWDGFKRWITREQMSDKAQVLDAIEAVELKAYKLDSERKRITDSDVEFVNSRCDDLIREIEALRKELAQTQSAFAARELNAQPARRHQSILRG